MRAFSRAILFIGLVFALVAPSFTHADWILTPETKSASRALKKTLAKWKSLAPSLQTALVLSPSEAKAFREMGGGASISEAIRVSGVSFNDSADGAKGLESLLKNAPLPRGVELRVNEGGEAHAKQASHSRHYQWALENTGKAHPYEWNDVTSFPIKGVPGEDMGLKRFERLGGVARTRAVIVAVLDTGIDPEHPALRSQIVRKEGECRLLEQYTACLKAAEFPPDPKAKAACESKYKDADSDQNGYPMDCTGWNVADTRVGSSGVWGSGVMKDERGHGTHVSGLISVAPRTDSDPGVLESIAPHARLLPVKVIRSAPNAPVRVQSLDQPLDPLKDDYPDPKEAGKGWGQVLTDVVARGLLYALRNGANVVNLSMGWPAGADSALLRELLKIAASRDVLVIASAGNDASDTSLFPCASAETLCVGSYDPDGNRSLFSNYGASVDVYAPGLNLVSTWPTALRPSYYLEGNGYEFRSGTSMAAPLVAGAAARLLALGMSAAEVRARLSLGVRASDTVPKVDLEKAATLAPRPWIVPVSRSPLRVTGSFESADGSETKKIELINHWAEGSVRVTLSCVGGEPQTVRVENWKSNETRKFDVSCAGIAPDEATSSAVGALRIQVEGQPLIQRDVYRGRLLSEHALAQAQALEYPLPNASKAGDLDGIYPVQNEPKLRIALFRERERQRLEFWKVGPNAIDVLARQELSAKSPMLLSRASLEPNGEWLFLWQKVGSQAGGIRGVTESILEWRTADGRVQKQSVLPAEIAPFSDVWAQRVRSQGEHRGRSEFWFVSTGALPEHERPAYDPWAPEAHLVSRARRLYVWSEQGIRTLTLGAQTQEAQDLVLSVLPDNHQSSSDAPVTVLTARVEGVKLQYARRRVSPADPSALVETQEFELKPDRILLGNAQSLPLVGESSGVVFVQPNRDSSLRVHFLPTDARARGWDFTLVPERETDTLRRLISVAKDPSGALLLFAESSSRVLTYETRIDAVPSGGTARLAPQKSENARRSSFLPGALVAQSYYPFQALDGSPGVYALNYWGEVPSSDLLLKGTRSARNQWFESQECTFLEVANGYLEFWCSSDAASRWLRIPVAF